MPQSRIALLSALPTRGRRVFRELLRWLRGGYRPERRYMRGAPRP